MIEALAEANPNLAVLNISGNAVAMPWVERVPAIVQTWFLGSEAGNAIAEVIFGEVNPSGRLPFTFPVRLEDNSAHALGQWPGDGVNVTYNEGIFVGYRWADAKGIEALFPFGHGLSYTTFAYGEPKLSKSSLGADGKLTLTVEVTNTGDRTGAETVQLYIGDKESSLPRPQKELKGFRKVRLAPGEKTSVEFTVTPDDLKFYDNTKQAWVAEPGDFTAYVAASAEEVRGTADFTLK